MADKKDDSNRRRKWAPKARTGCRTCKTRHVKCDEAKPTCRRCHLSGFRCDGYPSVSKKDNSKSSTEPTESEDPEEPPEENEDSSSSEDGSSSTSLIIFTPAAESPTDSTSSPLALTPLVTAPSGPYVKDESRFLDFFVNMTAVCVGRSRAAPHFWKILVPQAAYTYPSVRHALLATATANSSLLSRESSTVGRKGSELQVVTHTSKAIRSLLINRVPVDVVLLTSATLAIMDLFYGRWDSACMHITSGAKLAKQAREDPNSDPYIAFYCEAFASALPGILSRAQNSTTPCPPELDAIVRLHEAVQSLKLALESIEETTPKVQRLQGEQRDRILTVLKNARIESLWLLRRWQVLLKAEVEQTVLPEDILEISIHRIESPFSTIMTGLNAYLDYGADFDLGRFEVTMERTMPFFCFAKAGPNIKMREDTTELMYLGAEMRGRQSEITLSRAQTAQLSEFAANADSDEDSDDNEES